MQNITGQSAVDPDQADSGPLEIMFDYMVFDLILVNGLRYDHGAMHSRIRDPLLSALRTTELSRLVSSVQFEAISPERVHIEIKLTRGVPESRWPMIFQKLGAELSAIAAVEPSVPPQPQGLAEPLDEEVRAIAKKLAADLGQADAPQEAIDSIAANIAKLRVDRGLLVSVSAKGSSEGIQSPIRPSWWDEPLDERLLTVREPTGHKGVPAPNWVKRIIGMGKVTQGPPTVSGTGIVTPMPSSDASTRQRDDPAV